MSSVLLPPYGIMHARFGTSQCSALLLTWAALGVELPAQVPTDAEIRQLVTFRFLPGRSGEAIEIFGEQAVPLYERDEAMVSFRAFREVESPVPLDLVVVSAFRGMTGMDASNETLRALAQDAGTSIGAVYGAIGALSATHDDQFVEMLPEFVNGDPSSRRLVAFLSYRAVGGQLRSLIRRFENDVLPFERREGIPSSTGRFLISDGWDYLRIVGFDSLGEYQEYRARIDERVDEYVAVRREVILAPVPELSVR